MSILLVPSAKYVIGKAKYMLRKKTAHSIKSTILKMADDVMSVEANLFVEMQSKMLEHVLGY